MHFFWILVASGKKMFSLLQNDDFIAILFPGFYHFTIGTLSHEICRKHKVYEANKDGI